MAPAGSSTVLPTSTAHPNPAQVSQVTYTFVPLLETLTSLSTVMAILPVYTTSKLHEAWINLRQTPSSTPDNYVKGVVFGQKWAWFAKKFARPTLWTPFMKSYIRHCPGHARLGQTLPAWESGSQKGVELWSSALTIKVKGQSNADNGWLHNGSAPDKLPCSSVGIALHYVYTRRNQWMYRWTNVYALCELLDCCPICLGCYVEWRFLH